MISERSFPLLNHYLFTCFLSQHSTYYTRTFFFIAFIPGICAKRRSPSPDWPAASLVPRVEAAPTAHSRRSISMKQMHFLRAHWSPPVGTTLPTFSCALPGCSPRAASISISHLPVGQLQHLVHTARADANAPSVHIFDNGFHRVGFGPGLGAPLAHLHSAGTGLRELA